MVPTYIRLATAVWCLFVSCDICSVSLRFARTLLWPFSSGSRGPPSSVILLLGFFCTFFRGAFCLTAHWPLSLPVTGALLVRIVWFWSRSDAVPFTCALCLCVPRSLVFFTFLGLNFLSWWSPSPLGALLCCVLGCVPSLSSFVLSSSPWLVWSFFPTLFVASAVWHVALASPPLRALCCCVSRRPPRAFPQSLSLLPRVLAPLLIDSLLSVASSSSIALRAIQFSCWCSLCNFHLFGSRCQCVALGPLWLLVLPATLGLRHSP